MAGFDFTYDSQFDLLLDGFDVSIRPSDYGEEYVFVTISEGNSEVFNRDVPITPPQEGESTEQVIENTAQAAIDIFESERGTLGQGAGAEVMATKKEALCTWEMKNHEEWYLSFKGTEFEDLAFNLLEDLYSLDLEDNTVDDTSSELYSEMDKIEYELKMLNLERMRSMPAGAQIIIIQASKIEKKAWFMDVSETKDFLDAFTDTPFEADALKLVNRYIEIREEINQREEATDDIWSRRWEIENQMESLSLEALQQNIMDKIPTEGIGVFPGMAADLAELMEGVSIDEPLDVMPPFSPPADPFEPVRAFKEAEVKEKGKGHLGLDPAEVSSEKRLDFVKGDSVELTKVWEGSTTGGVPLTIEKGTKGTIQNEFDGHGDCFMVHFEGGSFLKVPGELLKKSS